MAQFNVAQRQVINTIEDTSKYQTGDGRRLRVYSDPLSIPVASSSSSVSQLANALSSIKPALMDYAVEKKAESYSKDINTGKTLAQTGGVPTGEMQQYGYDKVKSINDWTDWQTKVATEYDQSFDKDNGNIDDFLKKQWEAHPFQDKSTTYVDNFTALAGKTMSKLREAQGSYLADKQNNQNNTELSRIFYHDIGDVMGAGKEYTTAAYEARREDLKTHFPGKTNSQLDELAHGAVLQQAQESGDVTLFNIFKTPHKDGTPGLYEIPAWKQKIDEESHKIIAQNITARNQMESHNDKLLKETADTKERSYLFDLIKAQDTSDPTERSKKITDIIAQAQLDSESGIPISDSIIKTLMTASMGTDKKEETLYQSSNYNKLRLGNPSVSEIAKSVSNGDISQAGFEKLMNAKDAAANRAATRANKPEKPISSDPFVKQAFKDIDVNAGYSWASMTPGNEQAKKNSEAVKARVLDYIEESVDAGMSHKEAAAKGSDLGIKMLKDAGMDSKALSEANSKLDKVANSKLDKVSYKKADPVSYYKDNPEEYIQDSKNKSVPPIDARSLLDIQRGAIALNKSKKLKQHESTH